MDELHGRFGPADAAQRASALGQGMADAEDGSAEAGRGAVSAHGELSGPDCQVQGDAGGDWQAAAVDVEGYPGEILERAVG